MRLDTCFDLPQIRRHLFRGDISRVARLCGVKDTTWLGKRSDRKIP